MPGKRAKFLFCPRTEWLKYQLNGKFVFISQHFIFNEKISNH